MKKLALITRCAICLVATCSLVHAQEPVSVHLNIVESGMLNPVSVEANIVVEGAEVLDYLEVRNASQRYADVKLAYDENYVYASNLIDISAYDYLQIIIKDLGGTDWSNVKFQLNESLQPKISDYLDGAEDLGDGWMKVKIPIEDFNSNNLINYISFPNSFDNFLGVKELSFINDTDQWQWFGDKKFDNAKKENVIGESHLIMLEDGVTVDKQEITLLSQGSAIVKESMPFDAFKIPVSNGENLLQAKVTDALGNIYYSDVVNFNIAEGLQYIINPVSCYGGSDGSIDITVVGATEPLNFIWSNGATTEDITNLFAGTYSVEVIDDVGKSIHATFLVDEPNQLQAELSPESCSLENVNLSIYGGEGPYQMSTDGGSFTSIGSGNTFVQWQLNTNQPFDESSSTNYAAAIELDGEDNIYLAGRYSNMLTFGDGTVGQQGEWGNYLVKLSKDGEFLWSNSVGSAAEVKDLAVDHEGNSSLLIYVGSNGSMEYNGKTYGPGEYLFHFNKDGVLQWEQSFNVGVTWNPGVGYYHGMSNLGADGVGNIYVIGTKNNDPNLGSGPTNLRLMKFNESGSLLWSREIGGANIEMNKDMFVTHNGEIYITGYFRTEIDFNGLQLANDEMEEVYVAKYNAQGHLVWATSPATSNANDTGMSITTDDQGDVIVVVKTRGADASFNGENLGDAGEVLAKLSGNDGSVKWYRVYSWREYLSFAVSHKVVAKNNRIYLSAMIDLLNLEGAENFGAIDYDHVLMQFDNNGTMTAIESRNNFFYNTFAYVPIEATSDNGLLIPSIDWGENFTVVKRGFTNFWNIDLSSVNQSIVVRDNNGCEFLIDDLNVEIPIPDAPTICFITTAEAGSGNIVQWASLASDDVVAYNIYRETNALDSYDYLGSVDPSTTQFIDTDADNSVRSYRYVVTVTDACSESLYSNAHKTMHLTVNEGNLGQINLIWDGYEGIDYKSFKIYRGASPDDMELLAQIPAYAYTYTDMNPSPATQYYQVRIDASASCETQASSNGKIAKLSGSSEIGSNIVTRYGEAGNLRVYPNPGTEVVNIRFDADGDTYELQLIDAKGRVVKRQSNILQEVSLDRGQLISGIYTVVLRSKAGKTMYGRVVFR